MNFDNRQHRFYCGVDLHTRAIYCYLVDQAGTVSVRIIRERIRGRES